MAQQSKFNEKDGMNGKKPGSKPSRNRRGSKRPNDSRRANGRASKFDANQDTKRESNSWNDLSWYTRNPELLASAAMLAFPNKPGMEVRLPTMACDYIGSGAINSNYKLPGIMAMNFEYTIGISEDVTSPASIAAKELWGVVRSKFSGTIGFDAPDLFMYMIALDMCHAYISYLKRLYRTVNVYSSQNRYLPEKLVEAELGVFSAAGVGPDFNYMALVKDRVKLWNYINTLINMTNKFTFPDVFDLFHRHRWMNEHVYADAPTLMGQLYVFTPSRFFFLNDSHHQGVGTTLIPGPELQSYVRTEDPVEALFEYGRLMIESISNWEDAYDINGRLLRAFEGANNFSSALLMQDEIINVAYVPEILPQIHNLNVVEGFMQGTIAQDPLTNAILYHPRYDISSFGDKYRSIVDLDSMTPTPADVTLATRLTALIDNDNQLQCGSEVITALHITMDNVFEDLSLGWLFIQQTMTFPTGKVNPDSVDYEPKFGIRNLIADIMGTSFVGKWFKAPLLYRGYTNSDDESEQMQPLDGQLGTILGELTNATSVDADFLSDLHRVCLYSQFNCFGKT